MNFGEQYNTRSAGVKRLMKEASELREPTELYAAQPTEDNLFEWHFTVRGPADSDFDGGIYHGRILFPPEYPMKPPNLIILTPNGRFELYKKICLSISGYHPETWLPSWSIRTALLALVGFMPTDAAGAIGSLEYPAVERKRLAKLSLNWKCKDCGKCMKEILKPLTEQSTSVEKEAKELATKLQFKDESVLKAELSSSKTHDGISDTSSEVSPETTSIINDSLLETSSNLNTEIDSTVSEPSREFGDSISSSGGSAAENPNASLAGVTNPVIPIVSLANASRSTSGRDSLTLFFVIPSVVVFLSLFVILGARRLMSH